MMGAGGKKKKKEKRKTPTQKQGTMGMQTKLSDRGNEHFMRTSKSYEVYVSIFEPSRVVQTLMPKFTSPINPSFRSTHPNSVYLLDQNIVVAPSDISRDNECIVKPVFRFYPCRANFSRDGQYTFAGQELMDRATTIASPPPVNFHFSHSLEQPCEKGTELDISPSPSLSQPRITLHRVDTNRATFDPECYPINVKISPIGGTRFIFEEFFSINESTYIVFASSAFRILRLGWIITKR